MALKKKSGAKSYAQISDCYVVYLLCYSIAGHSLPFGALMYLNSSFTDSPLVKLPPETDF